jgi:hypothetical protein
MFSLGRRLAAAAGAGRAPSAPRQPLLLRLLRSGVALQQRWPSLLLVGGMLFLAVLLGGITSLQPYLAILLLIAVVGLGALTWLLRSLAPGAPWWIKASFFVVCGQLVLSYGFSNIIFFAGGVPIPLTDSLLMIALLYSAAHVWFVRDRVALPSGLWWLVGWVLFTLAWHLPSGLQRDGVGAARDAMPTVQMLYVVAGFIVVSLCLRAGEPGLRWLRSVLVLLGAMLAVYGLMYPFSSTLLSVSPRLGSLQQSVPIFGYFTTWPAMGVLPIVALGLWRWQAHARGVKVGLTLQLFSLLVVVSGLLTFFMVQARIAYVFIALAVPMFLIVGGQRRQAARIVAAVLVGIAVLLTVELSGLEIKGRVGKLSASGIYHHLATLAGGVTDPDNEFRGAAAGINQRKQWREYSLGLWGEDLSSRTLGIGYGFILTDLTTGGTGGEILVVREPHNSYVTTLTRTGLIGLAVMLALHAAVVYCCWFGYRRHRQRRPAAAAFLLGALFYETYSLLNAWGEPHFEVAHFAVPSYFIYGAVFAVYGYLQASAGQQPLAGLHAPRRRP